MAYSMDVKRPISDLRSGQRVGHGEKASAARGEYEAEKGDDAVVPSENQAVLSEELVPGLLEVRVEHGVRGKARAGAFERKNHVKKQPIS